MTTEKTTTERGFPVTYIDAQDYAQERPYRIRVQESSLATERKVWVGRENETGQMHLTEDVARELRDALTDWLGDADPKPALVALIEQAEEDAETIDAEWGEGRPYARLLAEGEEATKAIEAARATLRLPAPVVGDRIPGDEIRVDSPSYSVRRFLSELDGVQSSDEEFFTSAAFVDAGGTVTIHDSQGFPLYELNIQGNPSNEEEIDDER